MTSSELLCRVVQCSAVVSKLPVSEKHPNINTYLFIYLCYSLWTLKTLGGNPRPTSGPSCLSDVGEWEGLVVLGEYPMRTFCR